MGAACYFERGSHDSDERIDTLVHAVSFEDLFVHRKGRTRKALFEFLGLKGFSPDFSGRALAAKRGRCHLCDHSVAKRRHNGTNTINS